MEIEKKDKDFDAVKMMRDIRNKISLETQEMTYEQLKKYIEFHLHESQMKPLGVTKNK